MQPTSTRFRWAICALLFCGTTINYIDRQILSLVKPLLDAELGWSNEQFGAVNSAFQAAYAVGLLGFGRMVDRFGARWGYAVSIASWSLAAMAHALAGSIAGFRWARVALGLTEAGNFPAAIKAVAEWFPRRERAFATTLFNSGANVGAIVAPAIVPWLAAAWGWRAVFLAAGFVGFVWLAFWWSLYDSPLRHARVGADELAHIRSDAAEQAGAAVTWRQLLAIRQTWSFILAKFLTDPVWWFFLIWLPDYFNKTQGLEMKRLGLPLVSIYAIVTVLSIGGGWLSNVFVRRGWSQNRTRKVCLLLFAVAVVPIAGAQSAGLWGAVILVGIAGAAHQAWSASLFTTVSDMFPQRAIGTVIGIGGMAGSVGGILFPIYAGRLLDRFTAAGDVGTGYAILFGMCSGAYLLAFALNHLCAPRFEPVARLS